MAIPVSSRFLRPHLSDSGPTSTTESARPMANRLTERAMSDGDVRKWSESVGKDGSTTSRGKTPSSVMVINSRMNDDFFAVCGEGLINNALDP
ncbi:hypothetical protein D3C84_1028790 [compost metagenome]